MTASPELKAAGAEARAKVRAKGHKPGAGSRSECGGGQTWWALCERCGEGVQVQAPHGKPGVAVGRALEEVCSDQRGKKA